MRRLYANIKINRRSVNSIIQELSEAKKNISLETVNFHDDIFTYDEAWINDFTKKYEQKIKIPFTINSHFFHLNEDMLGKLKKAGLRILRMGIQSGSKRTNRLYNRPFDKDKIITISRLIANSGIFPFYDVIINNPLEVDSDKEETFDVLLALRRPFKLRLHRLFFYPKSRLTQVAKEKNVYVDPRKSKTPPIYYNLLCKETKHNTYWNTLYWLIGVNWLPKKFIRSLANSPFLKKYPVFIKMLCCLIYVFRENQFFEKYYMKKLLSSSKE